MERLYNSIVSQIIRKEMIIMKKRNNQKPVVTIDKNARQFERTAYNLFKKGKTNKKLNRNPKARKYNYECQV